MFEPQRAIMTVSLMQGVHGPETNGCSTFFGVTSFLISTHLSVNGWLVMFFPTVYKFVGNWVPHEIGPCSFACAAGNQREVDVRKLEDGCVKIPHGERTVPILHSQQPETHVMLCGGKFVR